MLYITHDLAVVAEIADQVVVMYAGQVMEAGAAREVFEHPLHPYTKGLLECAPRLDSKPRTRLRTIPGAVPAPHRYASHCRFADRCPLADADCRAGPIQLRPIGDRLVRCIKVKA
jgi:oligopeptide/dipeptide ABC transporter ATP-binding protein